MWEGLAAGTPVEQPSPRTVQVSLDSLEAQVNGLRVLMCAALSGHSSFRVILPRMDPKECRKKRKASVEKPPTRISWQLKVPTQTAIERSFLAPFSEPSWVSSVDRGSSAPSPPAVEFTLDLGCMNRTFRFRASSGQLGPLEQRLLEALWSRGNATVRELVEDGHQDLAYTTVMTTLDRLFKKKVLTREAEGRAFRYTPRFTREELHREAAGEALRQLLDASPAATLPLSYLVEILTERDAQLLDNLRQLVETRRRELRNNERNKEKE